MINNKKQIFLALSLASLVISVPVCAMKRDNTASDLWNQSDLLIWVIRHSLVDAIQDMASYAHDMASYAHDAFADTLCQVVLNESLSDTKMSLEDNQS